MRNIEAQQAILAERQKRDYHVTVGEARRAFGIAGIQIPKGIEAYVTETTCTVHEHPCLWVDWALFLKDGNIRVVLQNDLARPGMMLEDSVALLFRELQEGKQDDT